jgi:hypothetical protein
MIYVSATGFTLDLICKVANSWNDKKMPAEEAMKAIFMALQTLALSEKQAK